MASEQDVTSDEFFTHPCEALCLQKRRNCKSKSYCLDCGTHFCGTCLEFHTALHGSHLTVDVTQVTDAQIGTKVVLTDRCDKHGKIIKHFCRDHDEVICSVCAVLDHRSCKKVEYIPDMEDDVVGKEQIKQELSTLMIQIDGNMMTAEEIKHRDIKERKKCLEHVTNYKEHLVDQVETLAAETAGKINSKYDKNEIHINCCSNSLHELKTNVEATIRRIDDKPNKYITFIAQKRLTILKRNVNKLQDRMYEKKNNINVFVTDSSLGEHVASIPSLGFFKMALYERQYEMVKKEIFSAKMADDRYTCDIEGSCLMQDGTLVMTDNNNCNLKRFNPVSNTIIASVKLSSSPRGICSTGKDTVAICLVNKSIQIASLTDSTFQLKGYIFVNHFCYGIAYSHDTLFVSDKDKHVFVYNMSGRLLRTIVVDESGQEMFSKTRHVSLSRQGDMMFVADSNKGVKVTDRSGNEMNSYSSSKLQRCLGLCSVDSGSIFVAGWGSGNILQLNSDCHFVSELVNKQEGITYPQSLSYDKTKGTLYVTHNDNHLTVIHLAKV